MTAVKIVSLKRRAKVGQKKTRREEGGINRREKSLSIDVGNGSASPGLFILEEKQARGLSIRRG